MLDVKALSSTTQKHPLAILMDAKNIIKMDAYHVSLLLRIAMETVSLISVNNMIAYVAWNVL